MNKEQFLQMLSEHQEDIIKMYKMITRNSTVNMDIIQDFYIHAYNKMKVFRDDVWDSGYIYVSLTNFVLDVHKYNASSRRIKPSEVPISIVSVDGEYEEQLIAEREAKEANMIILDLIKTKFSPDDVELVEKLINSKLLASVKGSYAGEENETRKTWAYYMRQYNKARKILNQMKDSAKQIKRHI
jgi:DNA-directed RNA polymerase specialized sigma24 family protein